MVTVKLFLGVERNSFYAEVPVTNEGIHEAEVKLSPAIWHISWNLSAEPFHSGTKKTGKCVFTHKLGKTFDGKAYVRLALSDWCENDRLLMSGEIVDNVPSRAYMLSDEEVMPVIGAYQKSAARGVLLCGPRDTSRGYPGFLFNEKRQEKENRKGSFLLLETPGTRKITSHSFSTQGNNRDRFKSGDSVALDFTVYDFPCRSADDLLPAYKKMI
jgi:hypothetical protein